MIHRHLFAPIETPADDGLATYEDTEHEDENAADQAYHDDVAGFAALWTDRRFNECKDRREVV